MPATSNISSSLTTQRGVALLMVLGMVAIIAAWASTAIYEDMISIRRISNIQDEMRATMASESAYALTQLVLEEDAKQSNNPAIDSLDEEWAMDFPPFPIDEGLIAVEIQDGNRYYNLNDLVDHNGNAKPKHIQQLVQLFNLLELDSNLVYPLVDWMDKNNIPSSAVGAEDSAYLDKDYKIKNKRLDSWSELKLIKGFDYETIKKLKTVACVIPSSSGNTRNRVKTTININTAAPFVLRAIFPNMSQLDEQDFFDNRPYTTKPTSASHAWTQGGDLSRLSVTSDTFMLRTHAMFGRANVREEYLLSRNGQTVTLLWRERLGWLF